MTPMFVEGVRRNFASSSVFLYSVFLLDDTQQRLLVLGLERHEALLIVATLNHFSLPRPQTIQVMVDTLRLLNASLVEVLIHSHSMLPSRYNLCSCLLRWRIHDTVHEQTLDLRPGDAIGLALLMNTPILVADDLLKERGTTLAEGQTPELVFALHLLKREGVNLTDGGQPRLGHSKTPLRDALVKEFKQAILGKEPVFPEEDMDQRRLAYLAFLLGEDWQDRYRHCK